MEQHIEWLKSKKHTVLHTAVSSVEVWVVVSANNNNNDSKIWNFLSSGFLFHILVNSSVSNFIHYISNS